MGSGVAIIPTSPEYLRNHDTHYPYRFDSSFYYLTGFPEPEAVLVLVSDPAPKSILFCRDKDLEREIWDGFRYGPEAACEAFNFDEAYSISKLDELAPGFLVDRVSICYPMGVNREWDSRVLSWMNAIRQHARTGVIAPSEIKDVRVFIDEMRLYKSDEEIAILRRAAEISGRAHVRAMRQTKPGKKEYEIEPELLHEFRCGGSQAPAYPSIVAGGANACVLHYVQNNAHLNDGDLLLIDAGCELDGYASDITRTFPINGKFSPAQRDVYQIVLDAQAAAIAVSKPGSVWEDPHNAALKVLARGFVDLRLCDGTVDGVIESGAYKKFYMHRTGHWMGMDVHDVGEYKTSQDWRKLEPGMVFTVEPGCYIRPDKEVPEKFWNIGIRIEDDVVITKSGCEILTLAAPKTIQDIEAVMRNG